MLYNLADDPDETTDLSKTLPNSFERFKSVFEVQAGQTIERAESSMRSKR
jgi:hypothetical protein